MEVKSLSLRTDMIFAKCGGEILARDRYWVVRTPSNPAYHWGNFLAFRAPPVVGDETRWPQCFDREFQSLPGIRHRAFTWDTSARGEAVPRFEALGYRWETNRVLATSNVVRPPKWNPDLEICVVETDEAWELATGNQLHANEGAHEAVRFEEFKRAQMESYRRMVQQGRGFWMGARSAGEWAGDLGVFVEGPLARFQSVVTHPRHRRQGVCGRLVYEASLLVQERFGVQTLVMVADAHYHAAQIYESVGFREVEQNHALTWMKPS